jgi:putative lipoprotein
MNDSRARGNASTIAGVLAGMTTEPRRSRSAWHALTAGSLLAILVLSCSSTGSPSPSDLDIRGIEWRAVSIAGHPPVPNHIPTIKFEGARAGGSAGCNSYGADVTISGGTITVGPVMQTEMACAEQQAMDVESMFTSALAAAQTVEVKDGRLVLTGPKGQLIFER